VLDRAAGGPDPEARVAAAVRAGVDLVQVRDRALPDRELLALADAVVAGARRGAAERDGSARVVVNRRGDVALAAGACGVHVGFDAVDPASARRLLGANAWIGVSAHSPSEVAAAAAAGADYAHLAPIHRPLSKAPSRPPLGLDALREAAGAGIPVLAQGGIDASNARSLAAAGAAGAAVTFALAGDDPGRTAAALRAALDAGAAAADDR